MKYLISLLLSICALLLPSVVVASDTTLNKVEIERLFPLQHQGRFYEAIIIARSQIQKGQFSDQTEHATIQNPEVLVRGLRGGFDQVLPIVKAEARDIESFQRNLLCQYLTGYQFGVFKINQKSVYLSPLAAEIGVDGKVQIVDTRRGRYQRMGHVQCFEKKSNLTSTQTE